MKANAWPVRSRASAAAAFNSSEPLSICRLKRWKALSEGDPYSVELGDVHFVHNVHFVHLLKHG